MLTVHGCDRPCHNAHFAVFWHQIFVIFLIGGRTRFSLLQALVDLTHRGRETDFSPDCQENKMKQGVYVLTHSYVYYEDGSMETKLIGAYSSEKKAILIKDELKNATGFKNHQNGFKIEYYEIDRDYFNKISSRHPGPEETSE